MDDLEQLCEAATPGRWHARHLDDEYAMSLAAVSTIADTALGERWPRQGEIIAATLVQQPGYVDIADERSDENAHFIVEAWQSVPRMIAEIRQLRRRLGHQSDGAPTSQ